MSSFCNKILFFSNKEIVLDELLENLEKYMMTMKNSQKHIVMPPLKTPLPVKDEKTIESIQPIQKIDVPPVDPPREIISAKEASNPFIMPFHRDTLFWCLYIAHYGYNDYIVVERNYGLKELEVKSLVAEFLKANPAVLKSTNYKITKTATQEILSDLLTTQKETDMNCLLAIISYFHINIIMIDNTERILLEFTSEKDEQVPTFLIKKDASKKYHIKMTPLSTDEIQEIKSNKICLENYMKPMKPASAYKVADLETIAKNVNIDISQKKYKKNELYELIYNTIQWI
jgi:hypothetical protein